MAFQLSTFASNFTGGGARSSLFEVSFSGTEPTNDSGLSKLKFLCKSTTIPPSNISSIDVPFLGRAIKIAGDRTFEPWTTTILNDEDFLIRNTLEKWMDQIKSHVNIKQKEQSISGYQRTMVLTQFDKAGGTLKKWNFINAWPGSVSEIPLAWDAAAIEEFTCSWNYDYWTQDTPISSGSLISLIPPPPSS
tara:strand:- start:226 stop:798 length:573 start_codon:yes stop_codon:yes gene_type:complete